MSAYNELKVFVFNSQMAVANRDFFEFVIEKTTSAQYREILKITTADDVLCYLMCAYGCYALSHNHGRQHLITNPEKIFSNESERKTFLELFLNYARDELTQAQVISTQRNSTKTQE